MFWDSVLFFLIFFGCLGAKSFCIFQNLLFASKWHLASLINNTTRNFANPTVVHFKPPKSTSKFYSLASIHFVQIQLGDLLKYQVSKGTTKKLLKYSFVKMFAVGLETFPVYNTSPSHPPPPTTPPPDQVTGWK